MSAFTTVTIFTAAIIHAPELVEIVIKLFGTHVHDVIRDSAEFIDSRLEVIMDLFH